MSTTRYDLMALVPFDQVSSLTPGVICKAGLRSAATGATYSEAIELGLGINGSDTTSGNLTYHATNGAFKTSAGGIGSGNGAFLAIPSKYQGALHNRGSVQFQVNLADLIAYTTDGVMVHSFTNGASTNNGYRLQTSYVVAGASETNYRRITTGQSGAGGYPDAIGLVIGSSFDSIDSVSNILHNGITTDADGYVTIRDCWDGKFLWTRVNGNLVSFRRRKTDLVTQIVTNLCCINAVKGIKFRNVLVMSTSGPHPYTVPGAYRVQMLMHSYGGNGGLGEFRDESANSWTTGGGQYGFASEQQMNPTILRLSTNKLRLINTSLGGQTSTWMKNQVISDAAADGRFFSASHAGIASRYRPHFVVFGGHTNDTSKTTLSTNVNLANAACVAAGIVPIWVMEQNGNLTNDLNLDHGANGTTRTNLAYGISEQCVTDKATYGDVGFVDGWTPFGGDVVQARYVENRTNLAGAVHATLEAQAIYGKLIAAEIDRLIKSPPAYAWWK